MIRLKRISVKKLAWSSEHVSVLSLIFSDWLRQIKSLCNSFCHFKSHPHRFLQIRPVRAFQRRILNDFIAEVLQYVAWWCSGYRPQGVISNRRKCLERQGPLAAARLTVASCISSSPSSSEFFNGSSQQSPSAFVTTERTLMDAAWHDGWISGIWLLCKVNDMTTLVQFPAFLHSSYMFSPSLMAWFILCVTDLISRGQKFWGKHKANLL